jgi:hypothetical protein
MNDISRNANVRNKTREVENTEPIGGSTLGT